MIEPFLPPTPVLTERANRLSAVRNLPGYVEILRISAMLVDEATAVSVDYPGWDMQQSFVLKARAQAAKEHHKMLFDRIEMAIRDGISEATEKKELQTEKNTDSIHLADRLREEVLAAMPDDMRIPGSY